MKRRLARALSYCAASVLAALLAACGGGDHQAFITSGKAYLEQGNEAGAIIQFKNALQDQPDDAEARYLLGLALRRTGDLAAAEIELRKAIAAGYDAGTIRTELVGLLLDMGRPKVAMEELEAAAAGGGSLPVELIALKGDALLAMGRTDDAEASYEAALQADARNATALLGRARVAAARSQPEPAMTAVEAALQAHPELLNGWLLKANLLVQAGRIPDAVVAYDRAVAIRPADFRIYTGLVPALLVTRDIDGATRRVDSLRKLAPSAPITHYLDGLLAYTKGDRLRAREALALVLKAVPEDVRALMLAGTIEHELGNDALAVRYLSRVVAVAPDETQSRRLLATSYLRLGDVGKATELVAPLLRRQDVGPETHVLAAELALRARDVRSAIAHFERAVAARPEDTALRIQLGQARLAGGDVARGVADLQAASAAAPQDTSADLTLVTYFLAKAQVADAQRAAGVLLAKLPDAAESSFAQALVSTAKQDRASAQQWLAKALKANPGYLPAARQTAQFAFQDGKPDAAVTVYRALFEAAPRNAEAGLLLADALQRSGAPRPDVLAALDKAVAINPEAPQPLLARIDYLLKTGDKKAALSAAQSAQSVLPDDRGVLYALARAQQLAGDKAQALVTYGKLASVAPDWEVPYLGQATLHVAESNWGAARIAVRRAIDAQPDNLQAHLALVDVELRAGDFGQARAGAQAVQRKWARLGAGFAAEAQVLNAMKNAAEAESVLRKGLAATGDGDLANRLFALMLSQGRAQEAEKAQTAWLARHPSDLRAAMFAGDALLARQQYREAERWYRKAREIQPENPVVLNNLAWVLGKNGDASAVSVGERALALAPNSPVVLDTVGLLNVESGKLEDGIAQLRRAAELAPKAVSVRVNLARGLIKAGNKSEARRYLEEARSLDPGESALKEIDALLATL